MKIREIIVENDDDEDYNRIFEQIIKDCKRYIQEATMNEIFLYRGSSNTAEWNSTGAGGIGRFKARLGDRRPSDTPLEVHNLLNQWFTDNFGKPWRNGVFVTANQDVAGGYGKYGAFYPIGNYEYLFSPVIGDLYGYLDKNSDFELFADGDIVTKKEDDELVVMIHTDDYKRNEDLDEAEAVEHEISFWCNEYYLLKPLVHKKFVEYITNRKG